MRHFVGATADVSGTLLWALVTETSLGRVTIADASFEDIGTFTPSSAKAFAASIIAAADLAESIASNRREPIAKCPVYQPASMEKSNDAQ